MVAPKLLWRSVLREISFHTALGLGVIGLLLLVQNLLRYLEELASVGLEASLLSRLLLLLLPSYLPYAIPTALLFGILLTFGRMSSDGEIVALRASGIGVAQLLPPVLLAGAVGTGLMAALTFEIEPRAREALKELVRDLAASAQLSIPGRFRNIGDRTLYVRAAGEEACPLEGVFLADFARGDPPVYVAARCGILRNRAASNVVELELLDGSVHFAGSSAEGYRRLTFARMETHLDLTPFLSPARRTRELTFSELMAIEAALRRGETPRLRGREGPLDVRVQIHRRVAFSLSCILLAALALPLGVRPVRSGRSFGALVALALMAAYWLLLSGGQLAAEAGIVPPALGLWAGDALVAVVASVLIRRLRRVEV
jgi:lipopolysaccharide export system permease protein